MKKIIKQIFSQKALFILMMLMQVLFLAGSVWFLSKHYAFVYAFIIVIDVLLYLYISNSKERLAYKSMWLAIIMLVPLFGGLAYLFLRNQVGRRIFSKNQIQKVQEIREHIPVNRKCLFDLEKDDVELANLSKYLYHYAGFPVYHNTEVTYLPVGETWFEKMKEELSKAKHYIFLEYFIITEGVLWDGILEIIKQKALQGVDVRIFYDGIGTGFVTSKKHFKELEKYGIKTKIFNSFRPFLSTVQNNRDHRKITVIDGVCAFNGGTNLADEYINEKKRFGHWKDTAVMVKGDAAISYAAMFLQLWETTSISAKTFEYIVPKDDVRPKIKNDAFVQPYSDSPLDTEDIGKFVYLDLINMAKRKICITTPYLIPDDELLTALELAAKKGVDVSIITPHHPDKWYVYQIAWNYYEKLIDYGVKIYEYLPGFIHAKSFLIDDEKAVVGTINLDYRSLFLHFECGTFFYNCKAVEQLKNDCDETLKKCVMIKKEDCQKRSFIKKLIGNILSIFAPLL